jgi:Uma2 family endonuclease
MQLQQENKKYTYEDYLSWPDDERCELFEGAPHMQEAPPWQHQAITFELGRQFGNYLIGKSCRAFTAPFDLIIPDGVTSEGKSKNVVQPDLLVVCNTSGLKGTGYFGVADLVIEVCSPSTIRNDKVFKFNKYEKVGVKEYWIVEPEGKFISIFTLQENKRYGRPEVFTDVDKVKVGIFEDLVVDLKLVFG